MFEIPLPTGQTLHLGARTLVMGILNVTPDSFADGGRYLDPARAVEAALAMEAAGADLVDVGGESTRPGAEPLTADEELSRVAPVVRGLAGRLRIPISVDTYKASVAEPLLDLGASIINDISALEYDPGLALVVARSEATSSRPSASRRRQASRQRACSSIQGSASRSAQSTALR